VPAGGSIRFAPGRLGHHACRHYDRRARCFAATGSGAGGEPAIKGAACGKPGPALSLRDESPAGESRGGTPEGVRVPLGARRIDGCGNWTLRLPAFRLLFLVRVASSE
jgi:hypothetical protein